MSINPSLPSYQEQFGLTFLDGDAARSVYSPAAYFADLLQLLEDYFQDPDLTARRPDLKKISLDAENTVTLVPYLDIVNGLLAGNIDNPFETLKNASYPFNLPFSLEDERVKLLTNKSGLDRVALYKLFQLRPEATTVARLSLGLSPEVCREVVLTPHDTAEAIRPFYYHQSFSELANVETFLKVSALSGSELHELLSHNLHFQEEEKASEFFIHHELGGYVRIDTDTVPDSPRLVWVTDGAASGIDIPILWFSRVNRVVRLANQSGLSISELDLILRTCCGNTLDAIALQRIAIIKHISDNRELPIDEVCGFFGDLNTLGHGNGLMPTDLFNRAFNVGFTEGDHQYFQVSDPLSSTYADLSSAQALSLTGDLFLADNADARGRLMRSLHLSTLDLQLIATTFKQQVGEAELHSSLSRRLSLYYRISKLSEVLDLSVRSLFDLLDILQKDPAIRRYSEFSSLIHIETTTLNGYQIMLDGTVDDAMWLIQTLFALSDWLAKSQFMPAELKAIQTGQYASLMEQTAALQRQIAGFNELYQQLKPMLFTPEFFRAQVLEDKLARTVYTAVVSPLHRLVSVQDHRLLNAAAEQAEPAMYQALNSLHQITVEDFIDLGLEEKIQAKILTSLMLNGYVQPDGLLVEAMWPAQAEDFRLCETYDSEAVFERLYAIRLAAVADSPVGLVEFSVFLTDLMDRDLPGGAVALGLDEAQAKNLYDNLTFNGYINEAGTALTADFFAQMKNAYEFEANSGLAQYKNDIYAAVEQKKAAFNSAPCRIEKLLFSALPLPEIEIVDLVENLQFNNYIDDDGQVLNKAKMLALSVHDFKLVLAYYPYRHQILSVIQDHITVLKQQHLTLAVADFESLGQQIVARDVYQMLAGTVLIDEQFTLEAIAFFQDLNNIKTFTLPRYFDSGSHTVVFKAVQRLITLSQAYRLHLDSFLDLGFSEDEDQRLIDLMIAQGYVSEAGTFSASQVDYFLNINNALVIDLPGYEDFAKDIFFVVHAIAKKIQATVQDLLSTYRLLAQEQSDILFSGLQELFEIPADLVKVICHHIFHQSTDMVEQFAVPLLAAVNKADQIVHSPGSHRFQVAFSRIQQFAWLAAKLDLDAVETDIVFRDQSLVEKFSEKLSLPNGINRIDCLVQIWVDGDAFPMLERSGAVNVLLMYNAAVARYWLYDTDSYVLLSVAESDVSKLSPLFRPDQPIHAAFNDGDGGAWLISQTAFFYQKADELAWQVQDKTLGNTRSNFDPLTKIDAAFVDRDRKIYLFAGDQYLRSSSNLNNIDEGYPKQIKGNWPAEHSFDLSKKYHQSIDAAFSSPDETLYFFQGDKFISSHDFLSEIDINEQWGRVKNSFADLERLDAALALGSRVYFFSGDQCVTWSYSVENADGVIDEGSIQSLSSLIAGLPIHFQMGIDAAFKGADNKIRLFKGGDVLTCDLDFNLEGDRTELAGWGRVRNRFADAGQISAAFSGLDGSVYLFSQDQYVRYGSGNYAYVDEGYPKQISGDWGGLNQVDAAFILDGKTYLIGRNEAEAPTYVRYSTNDYSEADTDYPKPASASWWTDHFNLEPQENADFTRPDTVFMGRDGVTYLFKGDRYIAYDKLHRWWSQPQPVANKWAGMSFEVVDAAFTGQDGRTYLFSGTAAQYLRYSDPYFNRLDDRYPQQNASLWGRVKNNLAETNHIDAAVTMESVETITQNDQAREILWQYTYLFSGLQYFRYTGEHYRFVDEGYPKAIAALSQEPRFASLTADLTAPIDAAFADRRNVYLMIGQHCTVVSTTAYRHYENVTNQAITAVLQDEGRLYTQHNDTWHTLKGIEGTPLSEPALVPPLLRGLPSDFQRNINAAFVGTDKTTYVFRDDQCYNSTLKKAYPLREEWGRQRNRIALENRVDAAFAGTDGKTYLFSGDQYFVYTAVPAGVSGSPVFTDTHPMPIVERWGGLTNVNVAFVRAGKTYLVEAPNEQGQFRYVCYSTADYSQPDQAPQTVDISWWEFPSIYLEEGFDQVDAVLFNDEHMYLLKGDQFLQYSQIEGLWTYPRPLNRIWRDCPFAEAIGQSVMAAFKGHNGVTYFFSDRHTTSDADFANLQLTGQVWGRTNNNLLENARIDAAVVADKKITYLFSGDQYVRYSTSDYRFVDEGYPKAIATDLVNESAFAHIPASVSDRLATSSLGGITANQRTVYLFVGQDCHACSKARVGQFGIERLGELKNELRSRQKVDAAFVNHDRQTFLLSGDQYVRYSQGHYDAVDEGYPKSVVALAEDVPGIDTTRLSEGLVAGRTLDAAVQLGDNSIQIFQGDTVYRSEFEGDTGGAIALTEIVPTQTNQFANGVDAAFVATDGKAYFFKGGHYLRYTDINSDHADEGFPKAIQDNWGNLPTGFEAAIESAFVFEEKTYLVLEDQYVRYSDAHYQMIDAIYPQAFVFRWGDWNDYLLSDIKTIADFKALLEENLSAEYTLRDLLDLKQGYQKEPYRMLSEIFGWEIDEIKWLKRRNAFYKDELDIEVNFSIELILKMWEVFAIARKANTPPSKLYALAQNDASGNLAAAAEALYQGLKMKHSEPDWQLLSAELHNTLNRLKRDALLPYVIAQDDSVENARDLFAKMLVDVEMGNEAKTSRIKEAISAIQLYLHRYFVNLESISLNGSAERAELKQWWQWMRNYRVWEANRKVFLYPENYIRPELRDSKTAAFKKLEEDLLQGEVSDERVAIAFNNYLKEFSTVGNLKITGANVHTAQGNSDETLILFGHTRTEPAQYYYRSAQFLKKDDAIWGNWLPVNITVNSTRVFPIHAFGRIMVFWSEIEAYEESVPFISTKNSADKTNADSTSKVEDTDTVLKHKADIKYSFYDFNKQWVTPQTLKQGVEIEYKIDAAYTDKDEQLVVFAGEYCLISTVQNPQGALRKISEAYPRLPSAFHSGIDAAVRFGNRLIFFRDGQCAINLENDETERWTLRPITQYFTPSVPILKYTLFTVLWWARYIVSSVTATGRFDNPYRWGIAAAFPVDGRVCLVDHQGMPLFFLPIKNGFKEEEITYEENQIVHGAYNRTYTLVHEFSRIITRNFMRLEPVDAIFEDEHNIIYVMRKGQYECYRHNQNSFERLEKLDGFPKPIKGNLSFNMDKFFNRLHLATTRQNGRDVIRLTFTSPKANTTLLTGIVKDDFTFVEGDLRTDYQQQTILRFSQGLLTVPEVSRLPGSVNDYASISQAVEGAIADANRINALESAQNLVVTITDRVADVIRSQETLPASENEAAGGKYEVPQALQDELYELIDRPQGVMATFDNGPEGWTVGTDLRAAFSAYLAVPNDSRDWIQELRQLQRTNQTLRTLIEDSVPALLAALRLRVSLIERDQLVPVRDWLQRTLSDYQNTVSTFDQQLSDTRQLIGAFDEVFVSENTLAPSTATNVRQLKLEIEESNKRLFDWTTPTRVTLTALSAIEQHLNSIHGRLRDFQNRLSMLNGQIVSIRPDLQQLIAGIKGPAEHLREVYFGSSDSFPSAFEIENQTNFTFGEPDWHIFEAKGGTFLCKPENVKQARVGARARLDKASQVFSDRAELDSVAITRASSADAGRHYRIIRLTTTTIPVLSKNLFLGGIDQLLTLVSQQEDEKPDFSPATDLAPSALTIHYNSSRLIPPESDNLDYKSANATYYWEIFFHVPSLIAQTLNQAQQFEASKAWYEYIFDPMAIASPTANPTTGSTEPLQRDPRWQFLPFTQAPDPTRAHIEDYLHRTLNIANLQAEIQVYLNDPFDPHAIARIREIAYQKATMMAYIDNLLDWGDMLFRQYTVEGINEARMLYILAYDLLGNRPAVLGEQRLLAVSDYEGLQNPTANETDLLVGTELAINNGTVHRSVQSPYFFIPDNDLFLDYWNRVEDRLYKIRQSLNIDGIKQALPLFQPPLDPLAIVKAIAGGASLSQIAGSSTVAVPHYRFNFMFYKAKELVQKLSQFSSELLAALEKQDSEQLGLMQHRQEATILSMMTEVKTAQIAEAKAAIASLQAGLAMVEANKKYNQSTVDDGFLPYEEVQMSVMGGAVVAHATCAIVRTIASFGGSAPDALVGPFIAGIKIGGAQAYSSFSSAAEVLQSVAEGLSVGGEIFGVVAQHERLMAGMQHQADTAIHDKNQIQAQIAGAQQQLKIAEYELIIHQQEIEHHKSVATFMTNKFSNRQLYQWMSGQLSGLYYQSYKMAHDMAKSAEKAFQFERGLAESEVSYINGMYWNSARKGLMAGDSLRLDLDRMEQSFIKTDSRRFEISKPISLLELDPLAFLQLKAQSACDFELSEALFDYDFAGHYCRQIKSIEVSFDAAPGETVNATLTQLNHKTVLKADSKAVKYLIDPKGEQPLTLRSDWRVSQQIALSHVDEYEKGHGLFERRYEDDRYLPFEGTGAVSRWRLVLNGKRGAVTLDQLLDVTINLKYTALQGGEKFADVVKGLLKPYDTVRFIDLNYDFHDEWLDFLNNEARFLTVSVGRSLFPNMASGRITGIFTKLQLAEPAQVSLMLNNDDALILKDEQFLETPGLSVSNSGSRWTFTVQGDKSNLRTVQMVVGYKASV